MTHEPKYKVGDHVLLDGRFSGVITHVTDVSVGSPVVQMYKVWVNDIEFTFVANETRLTGRMNPILKIRFAHDKLSGWYVHIVRRGTDQKWYLSDEPAKFARVLNAMKTYRINSSRVPCKDFSYNDIEIEFVPIT